MAVMNVTTYGFTMVAARALGPQPYGAFAAVMNLLLVVSVARSALQATAARRIAAEPAHVAQIEREIMRVTYRVALGLGLLLLVLTPLINTALRLESLATAAMVGLTAVPLTIMGGQAGILQGERRWTALAAVYVAAGVPRLVVGTCAHPVASRGADGGHRRRARRARPGGRRHGGAALRRARTPGTPSSIAPLDPRGGAAQLAGAAGVLRAVQRRPAGGAQRAVRARRRPVRRRPDPDQGGAVPAAVRRRDRLPVDDQPARATAGAPAQRSLLVTGLGLAAVARLVAAVAGWRWCSSAATSTPSWSRSCGCSPCSARCSRCSSCSCTRSWPGSGSRSTYLLWVGRRGAARRVLVRRRRWSRWS